MVLFLLRVVTILRRIRSDMVHRDNFLILLPIRTPVLLLHSRAGVSISGHLHIVVSSHEEEDFDMFDPHHGIFFPEGQKRLSTFHLVPLSVLIQQLEAPYEILLSDIPLIIISD